MGPQFRHLLLVGGARWLPRLFALVPDRAAAAGQLDALGHDGEGIAGESVDRAHALVAGETPLQKVNHFLTPCKSAPLLEGVV